MCFFKKKSKNVLVADVGGTNVNFAVLDDKFNIIFKKDLKSHEINDFSETVTEILKETQKFQIKEACFAVAGPINGERTFSQPTNITHWSVDVIKLKQKTALKKIFLINDFEAIGFAVDVMKTEQYTELTSYGRNNKGTIAIIGAGTGLGMSILADLGNNKHLPVASEGGHANIPFNDEVLEIKFQKFLTKNKLANEYETLISGRGIVNIYKFLLTQKLKHNKKIELAVKKASEEQKPAIITSVAVNEKDVLCLKVMALFVRFYAKAARNLVLTTKCSELIIAGGIASKNIVFMQAGFIESFAQHDTKQMKNILERTTILVITDYNISLYGTANALNYAI